MYYPAMLDLSCFKIVVVGGGRIACRKVRELQNYGGRVKVISPEMDEGFRKLQQDFEYEKGEYREELLDGATLVIAATNDKKLNSSIGRLCRKKHILCNVVTAPELSSFIVPSSVQRGSLVLSVSTGGKSPSLAARIKRELEQQYPPEYEVYVQLLGEAREKLKGEVADEEERREKIRQLISLDIEGLKKLLK